MSYIHVKGDLKNMRMEDPTQLNNFGADTANAPASSYEAVNNPPHYGGDDCIEAIEASMSREMYKGFLRGNAMKYLWRYDKKGKPLEDLQKAMWYLERLTYLHD